MPRVKVLADAFFLLGYLYLRKAFELLFMPFAF